MYFFQDTRCVCVFHVLVLSYMMCVQENREGEVKEWQNQVGSHSFQSTDISYVPCIQKDNIRWCDMRTSFVSFKALKSWLIDFGVRIV